MDFTKISDLQKLMELSASPEDIKALFEEIERLRTALLLIDIGYRESICGLPAHHQAYCMRSEAKLALSGNKSDEAIFIEQLDMMRAFAGAEDLPDFRANFLRSREQE